MSGLVMLMRAAALALSLIFALCGPVAARTVFTNDVVVTMSPTDDLQSVIDTAYAADWNGYSVTIQTRLDLAYWLQPGKSIIIRGRAVGQSGSSKFIIQGDPATPWRAQFISSNATTFQVTGGAEVTLRGIHAQVSGTLGNTFDCSNGAHCTFENISVGNAAGKHISTTTGAIADLFVDGSGSMYYIWGSAPNSFYAAGGGVLTTKSVSVILSAGIGFPECFVKSAAGAYTHFLATTFNTTAINSCQADIYDRGSFSDGGVNPRYSYLPGVPGTAYTSGFGTYNNAP